MTAEVNAHAAAHGQPPKTVDEVAMGFIAVANETMCRPIRALTQMKGYDVTQHVLACFGGAGGQHACAIATALGIRTIFVHRYAGILSAVGIGLAEVMRVHFNLLISFIEACMCICVHYLSKSVSFYLIDLFKRCRGVLRFAGG